MLKGVMAFLLCFYEVENDERTLLPQDDQIIVIILSLVMECIAEYCYRQLAKHWSDIKRLTKFDFIKYQGVS